ncbi:MAG TPA: hypothetical protein VF743_09725, partial [Acidimicrobiales bacterium]
MGDVRTQVIRHWVAAASALALLAVPTGAGAVSGTPGRPTQEEPQDSETAATDRALVDVGNLAAGDDPAEVADALDAMNANVSEQLDQLDAAEAVVTRTTAVLSDADAAVQNTQFRIEELTAASDE